MSNDCPLFFAVMGYLFAFVLCAAMLFIYYILLIDSFFAGRADWIRFHAGFRFDDNQFRE